MKRICVFGGGAIGCHIAGHLARAGICHVSLVARGAALAHIRSNGIRVIKDSEEFSVSVLATDDPAALGVQDYIILSLKAQQLDDALTQLAPLIGPHTTILPPTTGIPHYFFHGLTGSYLDRRLETLDPNGRQWRAMPPERCLGIVYWIGAHGLSPGVVRQDGEHAGAPLGEIDGSQSERVLELSHILTHSGINARVRNNIRGDIWVKFVNSLCWNPVAILTNARIGEMAGAPGVLSIVREMMTEADAVAASIGLTLPYPPDKRIATTAAAPGHKMSMLQDFERGRALELDVLVRSIAAVNDIAGTTTSLIDRVLSLAALRASTAFSPD